MVVTLHLAQIEVEDFYSCNDMFYQTSVTKHIVRWEKELTTLSLKDKGVEMNQNVSPKFNTNIDTNREKTESYPKPSINLPDNRELKHATFLRHGQQPEVNISHTRTVVFSRFSN